jgi:hypothetical protein
MFRVSRRLFVTAALAVAAAACGGTKTSTTSPSTIPAIPTVISETFSGTLVRNAAYTHPFSVTDSGDVSVFVLSSVDNRDPNNNAVPIGVSLGTWNGDTCNIVIAKDNVSPGNTIALTGRATAAGNLCVRVYDIGFVTPASANYELLIDHY